MRDSAVVGLGAFVLAGKEKLCLIRPKGHALALETLFLADARYYYDRFCDHRFELALSVPMAYGWSADFVSAYQLGKENNRSVAVQLLKEISRRGVAHVGFQVQEHPLMIAGITFTW